ncbi:hypothetical protein YPPY01_0885, partial [Yersinia pestis PY-01]
MLVTFPVIRQWP